MTITIIGDTPLEKVRLKIGDVSTPYDLDDSVINYILNENDDNIQSSSVECLTYLIAVYSRLVDNESGEVKVKCSQKLENFKELLKLITSDPNFTDGNFSLHEFGGTKNSEIDRVKNDFDVRKPSIEQGFFTNPNHDIDSFLLRT